MLIRPYKMGSASAKAVKEGLRAEGVKTWVSLKTPKPRSVVVNWGNGEPLPHNRLINRPEVINPLRNKFEFFRIAGTDERTIPWTTEKDIANGWKHVFARKLLTASGGKGIVVCQGGIDLPDAPLFTKRVFGTHEYRIHVGRHPNSREFTILDTQRKVFKKTEARAEPLSWAVRNHDNGFTFIRGDKPPGSVVDVVIGFCQDKFPLLHFAAFDVIYDAKKDKTWILEGNSAPGLEGQTVNTYVQYIKSVL